MGVLHRAEVVFTMRLHMLIFAALAGVPAAGLDVDPKVRAFLRELELPNLGAPCDFNAEDAFRAMHDLADNRAGHSARLRDAAQALARRAANDAEMLRQLIMDS